MATTTFNSVTHRPNNATSPDGDLAICINLVNDNGTLQPLEEPAKLFRLPNNIQALSIHNSALYKNLICYDTASKQIIWFDYHKLKELGEVDYGESDSWGVILKDCTSVPSVAILGNTLIFTFKAMPVKYAIWKNNAYTALASKPPFVPMKTGLLTSPGFKRKIEFPSGEDTFLPKSIQIDLTDELSYHIEFPDSIADKISNYVMGTVNAYIADYTKEGKFIFPFILRYALRLYDGSLIQHSFPVLMIPNSYLLATFSQSPISTSNFSTYTIDYSKLADSEIYPFLADLGTQILSVPAELADWKDLVLSLDIFVSAPLYTYNQNGKVTSITFNRNIGNNSDFGVYEDLAEEKTVSFNNILHLPRKGDNEVQDAVESCSIFYKIHSIPFDAIKQQKTFTQVAIDGNKLTALTSQEVMTDEYNSHQNTIAQSGFVYNNRLNLANISQVITPDTIGSTQISGTSAANKRFDLFTTISVNNKSYTIQHPQEYINDIYGFDGNPYSAFPRYIFYPHTGASNTIFRSTMDKIAYDMPMKQHSALNGAVYFRGFGNAMPNIRDNYDSLPAISSKIVVDFPNKIYTSDVDNPFSFRPANINSVGSGNIRALSAATKPLSQGQFGAFPLYAFTDEGIWALAVSTSGGWASIQPVTRDVIIEGSTPLNIDSALIFFSSQGLMLLEGGSVLCISTLLDNSSPIELPLRLATSIRTDELPFITQFPKKAPLAYDYSHSRIYVLSPYIAWIYSLKSRTWSHTLNGELGADVINDYPTTILAPANNGADHILYALNEDCKHYTTAEVLTRPLKFGSNALRTLRSVITRGQLQANLQSVLYASRDNEQFIPIASSGTHYIRRITGSPYRSHCLHILVSNCDNSFAINSAEFDITTKHTNKLR